MIEPAVNFIEADSGLGVSDEEWGSSCYFCYAQCINSELQGGEGNGCTKGVGEIISRRRKARMIDSDSGDTVKI